MPTLLARHLYTFGSLQNAAGGFHFTIKNRLCDALVTGFAHVQIDGREIPRSQLWLDLSGEHFPALAVSPEHPLAFALRSTAGIRAVDLSLATGPHEIEFVLETAPFGSVAVRAEDALACEPEAQAGIPYDKDDAAASPVPHCDNPSRRK